MQNTRFHTQLNLRIDETCAMQLSSLCTDLELNQSQVIRLAIKELYNGVNGDYEEIPNCIYNSDLPELPPLEPEK